MHELADVEGYRRVLAEHTGRRIVDVDVRDAGVLHGTSGPVLRSTLQGRHLRQPWRHGKWLLAPTDGPTLAMHFGMTGALLADGPEHRHDRVVFALDGATLRYRDMRKLTGIHLAREQADLEALLAELGGPGRAGHLARPDAVGAAHRSHRRKGADSPFLAHRPSGRGRW